MRSRQLLFAAMFCAYAGLLAPAATATVLYQITINTSSQATNLGWIEIQFNPSSGGSQPANATISATTTDGSFLPGTIVNSGHSSGTLGPATTVDQDNGTTFNDYFEEMTFGSTITFTLGLFGPALDTPNGQGGGTFTLDFLDAAQGAFLFTNNSQTAVPVFTVDINSDGSLTPTTFASCSTNTYSSNTGACTGPDGVSVATFGPVNAVPEPSTLALAGIALLGLYVRRRNKF